MAYQYFKTTSLRNLVLDYKIIIYSVKSITNITKEINAIQRPDWYSVSQSEKGLEW